ncbi:MAG: hypothetical protein JJE10_02590 [Thermoleophilia bacterium]|nr:hypothetical protein [Thermoleophilia bacterium]
MTGVTALAMSSGCGTDEVGAQYANEPAGEYPVEVVRASFKPRQTVSETYDMKLAVRNTGDETIPAMSTVIGLPGRGSTLAFAYADPQPGLAYDQRPVWVLEEGYPRRAGRVTPRVNGGTGTSSERTFNFGRVEPGETAGMVWRVTAVRPGAYEVSYEISAGLGGDAVAVDNSGEQPAGLLPARITDLARLTQVNEKGQVVPLSPAEQLSLKQQERGSP